MKIKNCLLYSVLSITAMNAKAGIEECKLNEKGYPNISGEYVCVIVCNPQEQGGRAFVTQIGNALTLINAAGQKVTGTISHGGKISSLSPDIGGVSLENNCQELIFAANGAIWLRK